MATRRKAKAPATKPRKSPSGKLKGDKKYKNVLKKYGEGDAIEIITIIFMNARNKDWNKNQVYKRLARYEIDNPKLIEKLYSRFDELVRESYSL